MRDITEIMCIIDRSGSMGSIKSDVIGSFNQFLNDQKNQPGNARFSLVTFSGDITNVYDFSELSTIPNLTDENYICTGGTALYDAIGLSIDRLGQNLAALVESERPNKVIVVILTDGDENASREYNQSRIAEMIQLQQESYSWQFIFLAANQDACLTANSIGISSGNAMYFSSSAESTKKSFDKLSKYMTRSRSMSDMDFQAAVSSALTDDEKDVRD